MVENYLVRFCVGIVIVLSGSVRQHYNLLIFVAVKIEGKTVEGAVKKFRGFHVRVARVNHDYEQAVGYIRMYDKATTRVQSWYPQSEYAPGTPVSIMSRHSVNDSIKVRTTAAPKPTVYS